MARPDFSISPWSVVLQSVLGCPLFVKGTLRADFIPGGNVPLNYQKQNREQGPLKPLFGRTTTMSTQSYSKSSKRLFAVWAKASEKVSRFYVGSLGEARVLVMPNRFKTPDNKQPDYRVYVEPKNPRKEHRAFQTSIAALWASKINEGEFRSEIQGGSRFSLWVFPEGQKRSEKQPDGVIYMQ